VSLKSALSPQIVDPEHIEKLSHDETVGMLYRSEGEEFPESALFDLDRVQAAIAEFRNEFSSKSAVIGIWRDADGQEHLALWSPIDHSRAVIVAPRVRPEDGDRDD